MASSRATLGRPTSFWVRVAGRKQAGRTATATRPRRRRGMKMRKAARSNLASAAPTRPP
ncbi:hypothetical protein L914_11205 [Phytophthora nicotianae]|uniref:Uncharacterized protein n=2 Tax=Phytophthora nicotianae TaxID=4792 RepID=W2IRG7_PHYNI|nr:hypothetical protein L916_11270 [Phytophthora nicotianae]ETM43286.1 hypothetical protein L914_11205 [Phytophthora nicotianae]ETO72000.1 hypothetical protein F444_11755 [Phytophthora nicotianae P1976]